MVIFCYQIRYAGFGKHKLSESLNVLKPDLERYSVLVQQIKNTTKERKTLLTEKKATPFYQFVAHNDLAKQIAETDGRFRRTEIRKDECSSVHLIVVRILELLRLKRVFRLWRKI